MPTVVYRSKGTRVQATIASTLTNIVGLKNVKVTGQENETVEELSLEDAHPVVITSGTVTVGVIASSLIWDPLDPTHQFLHARRNDGAEVVGNIIWGSTGVEEPCKFVVTKFERSAEGKGGLMAEIELKMTEYVELNEADPS